MEVRHSSDEQVPYKVCGAGKEDFHVCCLFDNDVDDEFVTLGGYVRNKNLGIMNLNFALKFLSEKVLKKIEASSIVHQNGVAKKPDVEVSAIIAKDVDMRVHLRALLVRVGDPRRKNINAVFEQMGKFRERFHILNKFIRIVKWVLPPQKRRVVEGRFEKILGQSVKDDKSNVILKIPKMFGFDFEAMFNRTVVEEFKVDIFGQSVFSIMFINADEKNNMKVKEISVNIKKWLPDVDAVDFPRRCKHVQQHFGIGKVCRGGHSIKAVSKIFVVGSCRRMFLQNAWFFSVRR